MHRFVSMVHRRPTSGFSLLEVMVASTILVTVIVATIQVLLLSRHACLIGAVESDLNSKLTAVLDRMADDLKDSGASVISINPSQSMITFQMNTGYAGGAIVWGSIMSYALKEIDGESYIEKTDGPHTTLMARGVPNGGLVFTRNGNVLTISLTLQRSYVDSRLGSEETYSITRETKVMMLNE